MKAQICLKFILYVCGCGLLGVLLAGCNYVRPVTFNSTEEVVTLPVTRRPTYTSPITAVIMMPTGTQPQTNKTRPTETFPPTAVPIGTATRRPTETFPATRTPSVTTLIPYTQVARATETFPPTPAPLATWSLIRTPTLGFNDSVPIAHYPLRQDGEDTTGNNAPMQLENAPFQEGGVYCNGIYLYGGTDACFISTPDLQGFDFQSFSIVVNFMTTEFRYMPVVVGGRSARWIAFYLGKDGSTDLMYNNHNIMNCATTYRLNTWHEAILTYDGTTGRLYLDRQLGCMVDFQIDSSFNDRDISTTDFSNAAVFKGVLRDLQIYKGVPGSRHLGPGG